jgi:hypothetical protein
MGTVSYPFLDQDGAPQYFVRRLRRLDVVCSRDRGVTLSVIALSRMSAKVL